MTVTVRDEAIRAVTENGVNGIDYWTEKVIKDGDEIRIRDAVDGKEYVLNKENIVKGVEITFREFPQWFIRDENDNYELLNNIDCVVGDVIIQNALFSEIRYL